MKIITAIYFRVAMAAWQSKRQLQCSSVCLTTAHSWPPPPPPGPSATCCSPPERFRRWEQVSPRPGKSRGALWHWQTLHQICAPVSITMLSKLPSYKIHFLLPTLFSSFSDWSAVAEAETLFIKTYIWCSIWFCTSIYSVTIINLWSFL